LPSVTSQWLFLNWAAARLWPGTRLVIFRVGVSAGL
jgi:hypothetical protein